MTSRTGAIVLPIGVSPQIVSENYPRLYHMAEVGAWEGIRRNGLLSTTALLDLFEIKDSHRRAIESQRRNESVILEHPVHGRAIIRDQKPMDDVGLRRALRDGLTPREWYELLNRHVFFWLSEARVRRLLGAREYRTRRQTILTIRTDELLAQHADEVLLSPMNSGATKPFPHPRGTDTFRPMNGYPFEMWRRKRPRGEAIVELLVPRGVREISKMVERVVNVGGGYPDEVMFVRSSQA